MLHGFNSAVRGLLASQRALYTTNHNIDNANTKGYSRQQIEQRATIPFKMPGIGFLGTGTEVYNVERMRDSFVDFKYWNESAPLGEWEVKRDLLTEVEKIMGEPSDSSFRKYMGDFYKSLDEMTKNPSDIAFREPVRENAMAFTKHVNETAKRLYNMETETRYMIETKVKTVNGLTSQVAGLNRQIYSAEVSGKPANDLRDRRELLVDELSKIVNIKATESLDGKYNISLGGISMVDHYSSNEISFRESKDIDGNKIYDLLWENSGEVNLSTGELKGLIDVLSGDGEDNTYRGIPYYIDRLNDFSKGFADKFNEVHRAGYGLEDTEGSRQFFKYNENEAAATFTLDDAIIEDIRNIAAAGLSGGNPMDFENILKLISQREDKSFFTGEVSKGTPDDFINSMLSSMGVDSLHAKRVFATQEILQKNIEIKRMSISGVSLEEEMADMVRFQHVYVASSKMISTMDLLLDITVNRLGMVGR